MKMIRKSNQRILGMAIAILFLFSFSCATGRTNAPPPTIVRTVGQYQVTECGSIIDTAMRLEWFVGPDQRAAQDAVKRWIEALRSCHGPCCDRNWRLPTLAELQTLQRTETRNGLAVRVIDAQFKQLAGGDLWLLWDTSAVTPEFLQDLARVSVHVGQEYSWGDVGVHAGGWDLSGQGRRPVAVRSR
jgi:hypothetical protein